MSDGLKPSQGKPAHSLSLWTEAEGEPSHNQKVTW